MEKEEIFIPLLWHHTEPIAISILNNKLLFCWLNYGSYDSGNSAILYNTLLDLYKHSLLKNQFPQIFRDYFNGKEPISLINRNCFLGIYDTQSLTFYVDLDIEIRKNTNKPIILQNISLREMSLNEQVKLSFNEAFILLGNLFTDLNGSLFRNIAEKNGFECLNLFFKYDKISNWSKYYRYYLKQGLRKIPVQMWRKQSKEHLENEHPWIYIHHFQLLFLQYIKNQLETGKLSPFEVLRLSGMETLLTLAPDCQMIIDYINDVLAKFSNYDNLSEIEKLLYFIFLTILGSEFLSYATEYDIASKVNSYYKENISLFEQVKKTLKSNIPQTKEALNKLLSRVNYL